MNKQWQESVRIRKLIDRYAHDYRYMPSLGENDLRAMFKAYTEEYEDAKDDIGGMETTENMQKFVAIFFLIIGAVVVFLIGIAVGIWVGGEKSIDPPCTQEVH